MSDPQKKTISEILNAVYSGSALAGVASAEEILNAVYDETADALRLGGTEMDQVSWQFSSYEYPSAMSGAVTIDPSLAARQAVDIDGNVTGVTIALSATYPWVVVEMTTDGAYTLDLLGWETDDGEAITLPDTGKCQIVFNLGADNSTKYAFLVGTDIS